MQRQFVAEIKIKLEIPDDSPYPELKKKFIEGTVEQLAKALPLFYPDVPPGFAQLAIEVTCIAEVFQADRDNHQDRKLTTEN
jgi:hypothetical protein